MKLIILLSLFAVATQQQVAVMPRSWMMPFPYLQPSHFHDQDYSDGIYDNSPFDPRGPVYIMAGVYFTFDICTSAVGQHQLIISLI